MCVVREQKLYCCEGPQAMPTLTSRKAKLEGCEKFKVEKFGGMWLTLY
jgi:hypothetical protein